MKKTLLILLLIPLLALSLTSCVRKVGWVGMNVGSEMKASYRLFDGPQTSTIPLDAGEEVTLSYEVVVDSGALTLTLADPDRQLIWEETFEDDGAGVFTFEAELEGRYTLTTTGEETQGRFDILWEIDN
jgi:hypothetical protein